MTAVPAGRAAGKLILLGEHTVVHGAPALAVGLERGAHATAEVAGDGPSRLAVFGGTYPADDAEGAPDLARAFAALLGTGAPVPAVLVRAATDLPPGGGLGSSAALGVAVARAVERWLRAGRGDDPSCPDEALPTDRVLDRALAWERVFHANPSGVDTHAAAFGGCLRFDRALGPKPVRLGADLALVVASTGTPSATRAMVGAVAELGRRKPDLLAQSVGAARSLVDNAALALEAGDLKAVGTLMDLNQMLLAGLLVSTERIEELCTAARSAGALGAKLTGAGGGGAVVALAPPGGEERLRAALVAAGADTFVARVGRS